MATQIYTSVSTTLTDVTVASDHGGATTDIFGSKDAQNSPFRCDAVHPQDATQSSENRLDVVEVEHGENIMLFNPVAKSDLR